MFIYYLVDFYGWLGLDCSLIINHVTRIFTLPYLSFMSVILVTGGSGLVGQGIKHIIETEPVGSRFGKREGETWVFVKSREGDLRWVDGGGVFFF